MAGYNGFARPLDSLLSTRGYRLYNVNNLKLARFKEIFPAAAKNDRSDARKGLELFQLRDHLPVAKDVFQEVMPKTCGSQDGVLRYHSCLLSITAQSSSTHPPQCAPH